MHGKKMSQLKEAMTAILSELRPTDYFNLVEFSHPVTVSKIIVLIHLKINYFKPSKQFYFMNTKLKKCMK